jgi:hypothetical protein
MMRAHRIDHQAMSTAYKRTPSMHEDKNVGKRIKMGVRTVTLLHRVAVEVMA